VSVSDRKDSDKDRELVVVAVQARPHRCGPWRGYRANLQIASRTISTAAKTKLIAYQRIATVPSCCWQSY